MRLTKASRFALYAVVMMSAEPDRRVTATRIATELGISENHVAKVLQQLVRARIARSTRGVGGGYDLARPAEELTMLDIIECIDGPWAGTCARCELRGHDGCTSHHAVCGVHDVLAELDSRAYFTFKSVTVATLARRGDGMVRLPQVG